MHKLRLNLTIHSHWTDALTALQHLSNPHLAPELEGLELVVHIIPIELTVDDEESIVRMYAFGAVKLGLPWTVNRMLRGRRLRRGV